MTLGSGLQFCHVSLSFPPLMLSNSFPLEKKNGCDSHCPPHNCGQGSYSQTPSLDLNLVTCPSFYLITTVQCTGIIEKKKIDVHQSLGWMPDRPHRRNTDRGDTNKCHLGNMGSSVPRSFLCLFVFLFFKTGLSG